MSSKKENIKVGRLTFEPFNEDGCEGWYYADIGEFGEYQIQLIEESGHWHMEIPFLTTETESHSPEESAKLAHDFLMHIAKGII